MNPAPIFSYSRNFHNKDLISGNQAAGFIPAHDLHKLAQHIGQGGAWSWGVFAQQYRQKDKWQGGQLIALDLDNGVSVDDCKADPFIRQYAILIYPTASSTPELPKTRVVFKLDTFINDPELFETLTAATIARFDYLKPDKNCRDAARFFYGSDVPGMETNFNAPDVPLSIVQGWAVASAKTAFRRAEQSPRPTTSGDNPTYVQRSIQNVLDDMHRLTTGSRATGVFRLAARMGNFVGAGWVTESEAYRLSMSYAPIGGQGKDEYSEAEAQRDIENGIAHGRNTPAFIPEPITRTPAIVPAPSVLSNTDKTEESLSNTDNDLPGCDQLVTGAAWFDAMPDSWRKAMLFTGVPVPLVEMVNEAVNAGLINPDDFTVEDLLKANTALEGGIAPKTLNRWVSSLEKYFWHLISDLHPIRGDYIPCKSEIKSKGRPSNHYKLATYAEIDHALTVFITRKAYEKAHPVDDPYMRNVPAKPTPAMLAAMGIDDAATVAPLLIEAIAPVLEASEPERIKAVEKANRLRDTYIKGLSNLHSTPLPTGWAKGTLHDYRIAFAHAIAQTKQSEGTLGAVSKIAHDLGCSVRSVPRVLEDAGIKSEQRVFEMPVKSPETFFSEVKHHCASLKGKDKHYSVYVQGDTKPLIYLSTDENKRIVRGLLGKGHRVTVHVQAANAHEIIRDTPPVKEPVLSRAPVNPDEKIIVFPVERTRQEHPVQKPGYSLQWLEGQMRLYLRELGCLRGEGYVNPSTGEKLDYNATPAQMVDFLIGRDKPMDGLIHFAVHELGGVIIEERSLNHVRKA